MTNPLRRILSRLNAAFLCKLRSARPAFAGNLIKCGPNDRVLSLPVAGVMHEGHERMAVRLSLRERVSLRREPDNAFDPNAIAVVMRSGYLIGYVDRQDASLLAAWIDTKGGSTEALVSELAADPQGTFVGVRISTIVPAGLPGLPAAALEFDCERGAGGGVYLLLDCDEAAVQGIRQELDASGLPSLRSGMSFRPCESGRLYRWYVRMGDDVSPEAMKGFFADKYQSKPGSREARRAVDKYASGFDEEIAAAKAEKEDWHAKALALQAQLAEASRTAEALQARLAEASRTERDTAIDRILAAVFRDIELLRDSRDVISRELRSFDSILRTLHRDTCPSCSLRPIPVRSADGWWELHYSTGQKDDGRLYFKRAGGKLFALVSFKRHQERDIEYLRKH